MENAASKFAALLNINPGEGRRVVLLLLLSFLAGIAEVMTQTAGYSLFVIAFGAAQLPYVYIGVTIALVLVTLVTFQLQRRLSFPIFVLANLGFIVVALLGFRLLLATPAVRWTITLLPIWYRIMYVLLTLQFWNLASRLFDARQAKRLFGLIPAGEVTAMLIGGLLTPFLVSVFGTPNLLLIAALVMGALFLLMRSVLREFRARLMVEPETKPTGATTASAWWRSSYSLLVFLLYGLVTIDYLFIDNIFFDLAKTQFPTAASLASFQGIYNMLVGGLTLLGMIFVTGRLLTRWGLRFGLLAQPVIVLGMVALASAAHLIGAPLDLIFGLIVAARVIDLAATEALSRPASGLLLQPLPVDVRLRTQTAANGVVAALAAGLAAGLLLLLRAIFGFSALQLLFVLLGILLIWVVTAILLNRKYPAILLQALRQRRLDSSALTLDDTSMLVLRQALAGSHPASTIYALRMIESVRPAMLAELLPGMLDHPAPEVREEVLQTIERHHLSALAGVVEQRIGQEPPGKVRGAALQTLGALEGDGRIERVLPYLTDDTLDVQRGALVGLLRSGGVEGVLVAGERLLELARSPDALHRAMAASALGSVGIHNFYQPLVPLLQDECREVRVAALAAAAELKHPKLWSLVAANLHDPRTRHAAATALVAGGETVLPVLAGIEFRHDRALWMRVARICGRIGGAQAIALLKEWLDFADVEVRAQVVDALVDCGYRAAGSEVVRLREWIATEAASASTALATLAEIGEDRPAVLLRQALTRRIEQAHEQIFLLLSLIYERGPILRARDTLLHATEEQRALALEMLDLLVDQELKPVLFAVLVKALPADHLQHPPAAPNPTELEARLRTFLVDLEHPNTPWIKACALYALSCLPSPPRDLFETMSSAPDVVVRETATWALRQIDGPTNDAALHEDKMPRILIEKVLLLQEIDIFSSTPSDILAEIATLLTEEELPAGYTVTRQGEVSPTLYIIVQGRVYAHGDEEGRGELGAGAIFGQAGVLEDAPDLVSVTTAVPTSVYRLERESLEELMEERVEVMRGLIQGLSACLRSYVQTINDLQEGVL